MQANTGSYYLASNPSGFITGFNSGQYVTTGNLVSASGALRNDITALQSQTGSYALQSALVQTGANLAARTTALENATGSYYPRTNPSGFITGVDLSAYATTAALTGATGTLGTRIGAIEGVTGGFATAANLAATGGNLQGQVSVLNSATGGYYPRTNPSGFITGLETGHLASAANLALTGSNLQSSLNTLSAIRDCAPRVSRSDAALLCDLNRVHD